MNSTHFIVVMETGIFLQKQEQSYYKRLAATVFNVLKPNVS